MISEVRRYVRATKKDNKRKTFITDITESQREVHIRRKQDVAYN